MERFIEREDRTQVTHSGSRIGKPHRPCIAPVLLSAGFCENGKHAKRWAYTHEDDVSLHNGIPRATGSRAFAHETAAICLLSIAASVLLASVPAHADDYVERNNEQIRQACILAGCDQPGQRTPVQAPGIWGALAVSPSTTVFGSTWGYQNQQDAANSAVRECSIAMNAMRDCKVVGVFANACVALATSAKENAWGFSGTFSSVKQAADAAMTRCQNGGGRSCAIVANFCSPSQGSSRVDLWGAIALSPTTLFYGNTWNFGNRQDAGARALKECAANGARDCKIVATVANDCVGYATSLPEKVYGVSGAARSIKAANSDALAQCQRAGGRACGVDLSFCADGVRR
jgi:hypothetical protein